jgi:hypothetical protein
LIERYHSRKRTPFGLRLFLSHDSAGAWYSELGGLNRWCHIWAYKDAAERFAVRERARNEGVWPPRGGQPGVTLKEENMLVVPASFSPLH